MPRGVALQGLLGVFLGVVSGCGGVVTNGADPGGGEGGAGASSGGFPPLAPVPDAATQPFDPLGPACDGKGPRDEPMECDPLDPIATCELGLVCHLYGRYTDDPCDQRQVEAACTLEGPGQDGDLCAEGVDCAAGFACTVEGHCRRVCVPGPGGGCPDGLICAAGSYFYGFCA